MACGLDPDAFWSKTPRQVSLIFAGKQAQFTREHNERAWLAYHTAALPRMKKFPKLRTLLARDRKPQSPDQMLAIAKQWTLLLGGEVKGKPN
ncbi:hypothetical protein [Bradyrhizobium yuanmingense]|uniref:hypothetical protein n=1 Tax=Bradyrhizobium yuanmingense TaxID=108015 RepID=UPI0004BBD2B6|nr:hypothetical protein [Bradyrhizobium yuanmingense]